MNSAWNKNNRREIMHTLGRYFAILMIIALGVGFFSGLKITKEAMIQTGDSYISESTMYDYRLLSTLGFTDEDIEYFNGLDGISAAEGAVFADFIAEFNDHKDIILKAHSITQNVNQLSIIAGRSPSADNECLADALSFTEEAIGKTILLSDSNEEDTLRSFSYQEYTIVGLCNSVSYLYRSDRGTTKLAGGSVNAFLYLPEGGFSVDYYTELYLSLDIPRFKIFSEDYEDAISAMKQSLTDAGNLRAQLRYQDIIEKANQEIADAEEDYHSSYTEYLSQKTDAEKELEAAWQELEDAKAEISHKETLLADGRQQLEEKEEQYQTSLSEYNNSRKKYEAKKEETLAALDAKQAELDTSRSQITAGMEQIEKSGVLDQYKDLQQLKAALEEALTLLTDQNSPEYQTALAQLEQVKQGLAQIEAAGAVEQYQALTASLTQVNAGQTQLDASRKTANTELTAAAKQLTSAKAQLDTAKEIIEDYKTQLTDGGKALAEAKEQYSEGLEKYNTAKEETDTSLADADKKLKDVLEQIRSAREEVARMDQPSCYVLDRSTNIGYTSFENDSSVVEGIAKIFPIFFFLVAALVCSTTMTRMVDEQRTQIGTLKALGYSNRSIARKYVSYSGSAAVLGCILGYFAGTRLFPFAIWQAYKMLYGFSEIKYVFSGYLALLTLLVSLLCSVGATYAACRTELSQMPAQLMRPKAPKAGKRIFLERLPFLWRKINFLHKVSIRNILRYKKRLFMMLLGTGGCSALLLAGLGLKDSISNIADDQFGSIMMYDYTLTFSDPLTEEERKAFDEDTSGLLSECVFICTDTYEFSDKKGSQKINIIASDDPDITKVIGLHLNGQAVPYPDYGYVAVSDQLAKAAGVGIGDTMTINLNNAEYYTVQIGGVFKNYAFHYMYMSAATYQKVFGADCTYKTAYATAGAGQLYDISARLMNDHGVANVFVTEDTRNRVTDMMNSLNYIVWLVIACACALSFVVMYNLSNINITERNREIATIKVLGFFPTETYSYVFRENIVITLLSTALGLPAGILLHRFVMEQIKIEAISFNIQIFPASYLYALVITLGLTGLVSLILIGKIDRIPMAESLKSVE
ncbi:putative ABC transport system permease protein [Anaerotaenia torta]|uniref:ABC transporter permease n=1 Tax=Anaerotaenia torta TaxID=433293 RepID=UPI003D1A7B3B